jgi:hypothetical protein
MNELQYYIGMQVSNEHVWNMYVVEWSITLVVSSTPESYGRYKLLTYIVHEVNAHRMVRFFVRLSTVISEIIRRISMKCCIRDFC